MELKGKVAIVAGAIRGIGLAIARDLAGRGVRCVLPYYDWLDNLQGMKAAMEETGTEFHTLAADLTSDEQVKMVTDAAMEKFGRLDILVNNIERGGWPIVHGPYTDKQWELEFHTTVTAKWRLFERALPLLRKSEDGAVVNISSISGLIGRSGPAGLVFNDCYSLCNRAIQSLTETWARMAAPKVRVNELMIGLIETRHGPETRGWGLLSKEQIRALENHTLLGRTGTVEEVAGAVRFLVSDATFMTGAVLRLDGGYTLGCDRAVDMPEGVVDPSEPTFGGSRNEL